METIQVNILNPKAKKLLQDLASLDLISIREASIDDFSTVLARLRSQSDAAPSPDEIVREVEIVRSGRQGR